MPKIKSVTSYRTFHGKEYEVLYHSGTVRIYDEEDLPKTVNAFMDKAESVNTYRDCTCGTTYTVYENA